MNLRHLAAPLLLVLAAGCALPEAGTPDGEPGTTASSVVDPPPSAVQPAGLGAIEACDLLTAEEASALGVPPAGRPDEIAGLRSCDWATPEGVVSTTIDEELGIDELVLTGASSVTDVAIGSHQAKRAVETSGPGYCDVFFAVGESANVSVSALYLNDTPRACAVADQAAALIEPKLP